MTAAFAILFIALLCVFFVTAYLIGLVHQYQQFILSMCERCPVRKELEDLKKDDKGNG